MDEETHHHHHHHRNEAVLQALEALRAASRDLETNSDESSGDSPSMRALLELETGSVDLFADDPKLSTLSSLLSRLKSLASSLTSPPLPRRRRRRPRRHPEISRVAGSIGSEIQSWIDRKHIHALLSPSASDADKSAVLAALRSRLSQGFDPAFQDLLLRSAAFSAVESLLADPTSSKQIRDAAAAAVLAFVLFNKHVFVGEVLMGPTVRTLVLLASPAAIRALNGLISSIRSPLVDELYACGYISEIVALLSSKSDEVKAVAFGTVLEIGYYGRREAVEAMVEGGLIERLMELQRSEMEEEEEERRPFASCVARFWIQVEVGEGLREGEKRAMKAEVLRRVREGKSDAVGATIFAEVLWGSTVW